MKTLFYVLILCMLTTGANAQWTAVTNLSGTTNFFGTIGCGTDVTVIGTGNFASAPYCIFPNLYWIGNGSLAGSYTFTFATPVRGVRIGTLASHTGETIHIDVGGAYPLTAANITNGATAPGCSNATGLAGSIINGAGDLQSITGAGNGASATITIMDDPAFPCINTLTVTTNGVSNGTLFSLDIFPQATSIAGTIGGPGSVCGGDVATYTGVGDLLGCGAAETWTSSNPAVLNFPNPAVGLANTSNVCPPIPVIITHTLTNGLCTPPSIVTRTVIVNPSPVFTLSHLPNTVCSGQLYDINCNPTLCTGEFYTLVAWTDGSGPVGTGMSVTRPGVPVTALTTLPYDVTVTNNYGCPANGHLDVDINPLPVILGPANVCIGQTINLNDAAMIGGTWASSMPTIATATPGPGLLTSVMGISAGPANITCTTTAGCTDVHAMTVHPNPAPITGPSNVCVGATITLSSTTLGGTWSSSATGTADFSSPGDLVGITAGVVTVTYTIPATGCFVTTPIVVDATPVISGPTNLCVGQTIILSDVPTGPGGTWASSMPTIATATPGPGLSTTVTGVSAGPANITCTTTAGCIDVHTVAVNPNPDPITGPTNVCVGQTIILSSTTPGGTWSSSATGIADFSSPGDLVGITAGVATVTYTIPATGCFVTTPIIVNHTPVISGPANVCLGQTTILNSTVAGTWFSSTPAVATATAGPGLTSTVSGVTLGPTIITCVTTAGCADVHPITVQPNPVLILSINPSPDETLCVGDQTNIALNLGLSTIPPVTTFLWTSSAPLIANVSAGATGTSTTITGMNPGTAIITCTAITPFGCVGIVNFTVFVNPLPVVTITSFPAATPGPPLTVLECDGAELTAHSSAPSDFVWTPATDITPSATVATVIATPPSTTVYTVTATDIATGCSNWADITVIPVNNCVCSTLHNPTPVIPVAPFGLATTISSAVPPGNYFMGNNVTFTGLPGTTITLVDCIIFIDKGLSMFVDPNVTLVLDHCHLFCCKPDMWKGIELAGIAGTGQGRIVLRNGTMIEDAMIAVSVPSPVTPAGYAAGGPVTDLIVESSGAIFNKNVIGIRVNDYHDAVPPFPAAPTFGIVAGPGYPEHIIPGYPFVIDNTIFTSRDFYNFSNTAGATILNYPDLWPFNWPTTTNLKAPFAAPPYEAPYNIDNLGFACANGSYPTTDCNDPLVAAAHVEKGIELVNVGTVTATGPGGGGPGTGSEIYSSFVIGTVTPWALANSRRNIFDNLNYGIYAENSDVIVRNSVFMRMNSALNPTANGDGIFAINTFPVGMDNRYKLYVYGSDGPGLVPSGVEETHNDFYGCSKGVVAQEYYHVKAEFTNMFSSHSWMSLSDIRGQYGFLMNSSNYFDVQLNHNSITNISTGISFDITPPFAAPFYGQVSIIDNRISATNWSGPATMNEYVKQGISLVCTAPVLFGMAFPGSQINIDDNKMDRVLKGIKVEGVQFQDQPVTVNLNQIRLVRSLLPAAAAIGKQTGISVERILPGFVMENTITGPGHANPVPPSYAGNPYTPNMIEGIRIDQLSGIMSGTVATVGCNILNDINTGFYIKGFNGFNWINNEMNQNAYGMVLDGIMGPQGGPGSISHNRWVPLGGFWTAMSGPHYQTYTKGTADPFISPLYVTNNATENPINNGTEAPTLIPYSMGGSSIFTTVSANPDCPGLPLSIIAFRHSNGDTIDERNPAITNMLDGQSYSLYPNPSDGHITLKQQIADTKPVSVAIINATGQQVYSGEMLFENGTSAFEMNNKVPGLYLLQVKDSKGEQFNIKFIIK